MLALIGGGIAWYSSRPKDWRTDAIIPTFVEPVYNMDHGLKVESISLEYSVENRSGQDYTLSTLNPLMIADKGSFEKYNQYRIDQDCFIPAGQKVKCNLRAPDWYNTSLEIDGFGVFDTALRYKINFPKPNAPKKEEKGKTDKGDPIVH